jgi:heterodisulfide reductase subunit A
MELTKWGTIVADPDTMQTEIPHVFAAGDVESGPASAIEAIGAGKTAAASIDSFLRGRPFEVKEKRSRPDDIPKEGVEEKPRTAMPVLPINQRAGNFDAVELGFTEEMAVEEAGRCLNCGVCCECLLCDEACEPKALLHDQEEERIDVEVGTILIATGFKAFDPSGLANFGYGVYPNVYTSLEAERLLNSSGPTGGEVVLRDGRSPKSVGILHCIGSRDEKTNPHCSRVCCMYSLKLAHLIKERTGAEVYNFYIDMRTPGKGFEEFYQKILEEGVHFIRGKVAEITDHAIDEAEEGKLVLRAEDTLSGVVRRIPVDMAVLSVGLEPQADSTDVSTLFKITCASGGFFMERHPKLAPVETFTDGIFLAGACQGPKDIPDVVAQAYGAAAQALALIDKGEVELEPNTAYITEELCSGCKTCIPLCPYTAISFDEEKAKAVINEALCKGCGACVAACPSGSIGHNLFEVSHILAEIRALTETMEAKA